jgi:acetyl-CoA acetyltransferase
MAMAHIAGVGMTRFGKQSERSVEDIGREALLAAMKDAGVSRNQIGEVFCGSTFGGSLIGQRILRYLVLTVIHIKIVEMAC